MDTLGTELFEKKMFKFMKENPTTSSTNMNDSELLDQIQISYEDAQGCGVKSERGVMEFIWLGFATEPDFFRTEHFDALFKSNELTPDECIDNVYDELANQPEDNGD